MSHKNDIVDENGNAFPMPEPGSDMANIIYLLEYGRVRGFRIGPTIKIGETVVQVRDLRQERDMAKDGQQPDLVEGSDMATLLGSD